MRKSINLLVILMAVVFAIPHDHNAHLYLHDVHDVHHDRDSSETHGKNYDISHGDPEINEKPHEHSGKDLHFGELVAGTAWTGKYKRYERAILFSPWTRLENLFSVEKTGDRFLKKERINIQEVFLPSTRGRAPPV